MEWEITGNAPLIIAQHASYEGDDLSHLHLMTFRTFAGPWDSVQYKYEIWRRDAGVEEECMSDGYS